MRERGGERDMNMVRADDCANGDRASGCEW